MDTWVRSFTLSDGEGKESDISLVARPVDESPEDSKLLGLTLADHRVYLSREDSASLGEHLISFGKGGN